VVLPRCSNCDQSIHYLFPLVDEDEDHILISSDEELEVALTNNNGDLLRIFVLIFQGTQDVKGEVCCCFWLLYKVLYKCGGITLRQLIRAWQSLNFDHHTTL